MFAAWHLVLHFSIINQSNPIILKFLLIFLLTVPGALMAQERTLLNGKISAAADGLEGVYVINRNADASVVTQLNGYFSIPARAGDTLVFSAVQFVGREVVVTPENLKESLFVVRLENQVNQLQELVITDYRHINAESLGLVPKGQKQFTPAERKVFTSRDGLDGFINALNGRTRMLKQVVEVEKKESLMDKINYIYTEDDIVKQFKIPQEYVRGFIFYIAEDKNFARAIKDKNDTMAKFLMSGLATQYLSLITDEK